MAVSSSRLGISGECDAVEFKANENGVTLYGLDGKYTITPIEYKRGKPKEDECDVLQLTAQAICLEEMLCCDIPFGYIYYGEIRHRIKILFDKNLREQVESIVHEMHELYKRKYTPKVKRRKACNACSLKNICMPVICSNKSASEYMKSFLDTEDGI